MIGGSRRSAAPLRLVRDVPERRSPVLGAGDGLTGCDPQRFVLLGYAHDRRGVGDGAYPALDAVGGVLLLPGEQRVGAWRGRAATAVRRAPGAARVQSRRRWRGASGPVVTLTDRRLVVHGPSPDGDGAHIELERIARVRVTYRWLRAQVDIDVLLHCTRSGASAQLCLTLVLGRRASGGFIRALSAAHRTRWDRYDLPIPVAAAIAAARPHRAPRELRYDPVVHMPLGVTDAVRGPGASPATPQRQRAPWRTEAQAARGAAAGSANAPASSS
ncbi:MAG: hypothetical protein ACSLFR_08040 [Solirubrobacteraceae bacterium]